MNIKEYELKMEKQRLQVEKTRKKFDERLKTLQTYEHFKRFLKDLNATNTGLVLVGKKRGYEAYHFTHLYDYTYTDESTIDTKNPKYLNKVDYLYADSVIKGQSYVKNLYRALKVSL